MICTWKALKNVQLESTLLRTEVSLHQKEEEVIRLEQKNNRLLQEVEQLRSQSSKAIKLFEKRTMEGTLLNAIINFSLANGMLSIKVPIGVLP